MIAYFLRKIYKNKTYLIYYTGETNTHHMHDILNKMLDKVQYNKRESVIRNHADIW